MSALFPGSAEAERFWRNITDGVDLFSDVPASHWRIDDYYDPAPSTPDKMYARRGGFLPDVEFPPMEFGIPPNVVSATDTAQLLALRAAQQVLEDATGTDFSHIDRDRVSVILGAAGATELFAHMSGRLQLPVWERTLRAAGVSEREISVFSERIAAGYAEWQENTFPGLLGNVIAGRIANRFDLGGTNCVIDAACASSLAALEVGLHELYLGESDLVITGGVDAFNDIAMFMCFAKVTALSPTGDCRPFSDKADGTMLGEGLAMFALKRLDDAERDGDRIYAVIRGIGASSDGRAKSIYAPSPAGQAKALRRAYAAAGYGPDTVGLVEAHGTGTKAGDAAEFAALREVFEASGRDDRQWCAIGSVKSQVGHTKGAAGACGLFKTVMALHHKALPPTIKVDRPNPSLEIENTPFYLSTRTKPWVADEGVPRRAAVSSFGFGGTNFHVAVEEYTGPGKRAWRYRSWDPELVVLGASSAEALSGQAAELAASLVDTPDMLSYLARSTQTAYDATHPHRLAIVADGVSNLRAVLTEVAEKLRTIGATTSFASPKGYYYSAQRSGPVALLFPGQGSQYLGMGADLPQLYEPALSPWELARGNLLDADRDLHKVVWPKTAFADKEWAQQAAELTKTEWAQPAIGAHSLSLLAVIRALGITPISVGGHSFGEVSALCAAGVFSQEVALRIAHRRGLLMADAASGTDGAMCAVTAPISQVRRQIAEWGLAVEVANHNSPSQVVLSGRAATIGDAVQRFSAAGVNVRRLDVATAFHSEIVSAAAVPFAASLTDTQFAMPEVPVYANATAQPYTGDAAAMRATLADQITKPVRFAEQIEAMWRAGARTFVEVGPGSVLTNLVGKCLEDKDHCAVSLDTKGRNGIRSLWLGLAQLVAAGIPMSFEPLWADYRPGDDPRSRHKPKLVLAINGANYGKPEIADEPVPRPVAVETAANHGGYTNGHTAKSDLKLTLSETITPAAPVNGTPTVQSPPTTGNGSTATAAVPPIVRDGDAAPLAPSGAPSVARDLNADVLTEMFAAVETLKQTVDQLQGLLHSLVPKPAVVSSPASVAAAPPPSPPPSPPRPTAAPPGVDLVAQMLEVVADKTGYPAEMLDLSMALEADLGIDSIKRVEILSAVQQRVPGLPEVETAAMAGLGTLNEIADYFQGLLTPTYSAPGGDHRPFELAGAAIPRYAVRAVAVPASGMGMPGLHRVANVEIVGGPDAQDANANALAATLRNQGIRATVVAHTTPDAEAVIHLGGLAKTATRSETLALNRMVFADAQRVAAKFQERGGTFVTVQDTGGSFGLLGDPGQRAWAAGIAGLAKTAAQEWPAAQVKAIDLAVGSLSPVAVAECLAQEVMAGGAELEVGLGSPHGRIAIVADEKQVATRANRIGPQDVIVVSGGGRGVTAASVVALAEQTKAGFVLIGRTELGEEPAVTRGLTTDAELKRAVLSWATQQGRKLTPRQLDFEVQRILADREVRATLNAVQGAGARVRYASVDVCDTAQLNALLDSVRTDFGPITGLVHGAGVLADAPLQKKNLEGFDRVFDTKVGGLCALLDATAADSLKLICLFSSVAARTGNTGQSDYAMANEILNKVALAEQARRGRGCLVRALGWGPWDSGMVTPALKSMFESRGITLVERTDGAKAFVSEVLDGRTDHPEVLLGGGVSAGPPTQPIPAAGRAAFVVANAARQPHVLDHRIKGNVVLPVVQALEWFVRMAEACRPGHRVARLLDVKVLRGVVLHDFERHGDRLLVRCAPVEDQPNRLLCTLSDFSESTAYYSAMVEIGSGTAQVPAGAQAAGGCRLPHEGVHYESDGALFHGPAFQVLDGVDCQSSTATGSLHGLAAAGWRDDGWATDPAALDGCLQLATVWSFEQLGHKTLPLRLGEVVRYRAGALGAGLRCVLSNGDARSNRAICDIDLVDAENRLIAGVKRLELYTYGS
ncbi:SDR family oxidoreductase [Mycobacterium szulgai]|nr:SDR family oxidoreductase [Mycobacterium szulgai]